jgi:lipopolysaccharide/colanic/teichoic acid biosynthesis glycosyltransferase
MAATEVLERVPVGSAAFQMRALWAKRVFDVAIGLPLCILMVPVVLLFAMLLAAQHRASPFFVHDRIGHGGRRVAIPKLRTLAPGFHPYADKTKVAVEAPTRLAQFLRRTHLDELPQLFLVPFGRLSLVGPRPRMISEAAEHGDPEYEAIRTSVLQGCTGLWQVSGHEGRVSDKPEFDRFYVEQHTVRLDAWILWRTVGQVFTGARQVDVADIPRWVLRRPDVVLAEAA